MVSRRNALHLAGGTLLGGLAGCVGESDSSGTATRTETARTETEHGTPTATNSGTPEEPTDWTPTWRHAVPEEHVLGLSTAGETLYATLSSEGGPSAVARIDPSDGSVAWRAEFEGEAVTGSYAGYRPMARDKWDVTLAGDVVYSVNGAADSFDWTALHALDRASGDRRWSFRRERRLTTRGVADGTVFATGREFFEPEHAHDQPDEPLTSVLYALDADSGEVRWTREFAGVADVAVGTDAAYVAAGDRLVSLGLDGERRWRFAGDAPPRTVRVADDRVFYCTEVDSDRSTVHGLDLAGDRVWKHTRDASEFLLDGDRLYAGGDGVVAFDPDGSVAWSDDAHGKWLLLGPAGDTLYTREGGQAVGAYALPEGDALWSFDPEEKYAWPVAATAETAVAEGYAEGRALYAVDRESGAVQKRYDAGSRVSLFAATALGDRVFVGDSRSRISAFDA